MAETHLRFGGSSAHRWMRCAGSVSLLETLPPGSPSEAMARGTRAHALLEWALNEDSASVEHYVGRALVDGDPIFEADDIRAVQMAVDYIRGRKREMNRECILFSENMYRILPDMGGTADCVLLWFDDSGHGDLEIIDYKHGSGVFVPAEDNEQLLVYAAAVLVDGVAGVPADLTIDTIKVTIVQPRCYGGEPIRSADYTTEQVHEFAKAAVAARDAASVENPVLTPGEHCHEPFRCKAAGICPAVMKAIAAPDRKTIPLDPHDSDLVFRFADPSRARGNLPALAASLSAIPLIEAWIKSIKETAYQEALNGAEVPGYKLVKKRATRTWESEEAAKSWLSENTWLEEDDIAPRVLSSVAQIEAKLKAAGDKESLKPMALLVNRDSSGYSLVPESHKGDAVTVAELAQIGGGSAELAESLDPRNWKEIT